jgi:hypothetical protein
MRHTVLLPTQQHPFDSLYTIEHSMPQVVIEVQDVQVGFSL